MNSIGMYLVGFAMGASTILYLSKEVEGSCQKEAIARGYAEYTVNATTGDVKWQWRENK